MQQLAVFHVLNEKESNQVNRYPVKFGVAVKRNFDSKWISNIDLAGHSNIS